MNHSFLLLYIILFYIHFFFFFFFWLFFDLVSRYDFHASNFLMLVQLSISASALFVCRTFGIVKFPAPNMVTANKVFPCLYSLSSLPRSYLMI